MPYVNIWIHVIFTTKNKLPYLSKEVRSKVIHHIIENADQNDIHIDYCNGYDDHLHLLVSLNTTQSVSFIVKQIKGETSRWINKNNITKIQFEWQREYYVSSISKSHLDLVRDYICKQETHHKDKTLDAELNDLYSGFNTQ